MTPNVGSLDRGARVAAGLLLIVLAATGVVGPWGYVGVMLLATGLLRVCPAYSLVGVNTCATKPR